MLFLKSFNVMLLLVTTNSLLICGFWSIFPLILEPIDQLLAELIFCFNLFVIV